MKRAAAGLAAALAFAAPAAGQDSSVAPADAPAEAAYGPPPPPQEMGPFPPGEVAGSAAAPAVGDPPAATPTVGPADGAAGGTAESAAEAQFKRLFGEQEPATAPGGEATGPEGPSVPGWLWGVVLLMVVALFFARRTLNLKRSDDEGIKVLSRASLGKDGNIAVLEVGDGQGGRRRLMVGYGSGAPRLVADLTPIPEFGRMDFEAPPAPRSLPTAPRVSPSTRNRDPGAAATEAGDPTSTRWVEALRAAEGSPSRSDRKAAPPGVNLERRGDLIAEVLAERSRRTVQVGDGFSLDDVVGDAGEDADGGAPGVTYTARGTTG